MRVALTLLVALMTVAVPVAALANCSAASPPPTSNSTPSKTLVEKALDVVGLGGVTNITNTTTNITNNFFTTAEQTPATTPTAATTQTAAFAPGGGFGGGGGGGGMGAMGGGFSGSSSAGGQPINPSDTSSGQVLASAGTFGGGGGGTTTFSDPITMASLGGAGGTTGNLVMMAAEPSNDQPLTPGIPLMAASAPVNGPDDSMTVALASPRTDRPALLDGVKFEGEASASTAHVPGTANTTMLAALIGVGMLGAGWAWRSLGI
jgi:hypothetical protein